MTTPRVTVNGITGYIQNGTAYLRLADLAVCIGFSRHAPDGSLQPDWETLSPLLERLGLPSGNFCSDDSFVPVSVFHCLAQEIGTPVAQRFQSYVDRTVIPALENADSCVTAESPALPSPQPEAARPSIEQAPATGDAAQEVQPKEEKPDERDWHNNEVIMPGDRDHKTRTGIVLAMLAILIIAVAVGINAVNKYKEHTENSESLPQVTVSASDAKETASTTQTKKPSSNIISDFDKLSLVIAAEDAIKKELVSPNSAKFPVYSLWDVEKIGDTYYSVTSYVDAKNRLGVELRQDVNVIIDYNGLSYSILFVTIDDEVYMGSSLPVKAA